VTPPTANGDPFEDGALTEINLSGRSLVSLQAIEYL